MSKPRFLVSRTDRAGDLLLTLPVFRELRRNFPHSHIIAHVRQYTAPLLTLCPEIDEIIVDDDFAPGLTSSQLPDKIGSLAIDQAVIVHPSGRAILAAWRAGISKRTGRASNIWQLLLNDRRVQKRSKNEKHEFCYNLDLLTGIAADIDYSPYHLQISDDKRIEAMTILAGTAMNECRPVIIHPGHGGSAHNLTPPKYAEIAAELMRHQIPVLISFGPGEEHLQSLFPEAKPGRLGYLTGIPDLAKLAAVFSCCSAFIGGSTGPLHLAAALQLPCVAFFPPVKAMTPKRWGPTGSKHLVIMPELNYCNGKCQQCRHSGCMDRLDIDPAITWLLQDLKNEHTIRNK